MPEPTRTPHVLGRLIAVTASQDRDETPRTDLGLPPRPEQRGRAENSALAGDSADVLVWGAQFERGPVPTSTIVTDGGPATRAAEALSLDWGRLGVRDGPAVLRLFFADGATEDVATTIAGGTASVPPRLRPLVAVRLA